MMEKHHEDATTFSQYNVIDELIPFWRRPRLLYTAVFVWISITGGRFLASFLEQEVQLTPTAIGTLLAIQDATGIVTSSFSGLFADWMEQKYPRKGRTIVLSLGSCLGSIFFCLHGCNRLFPSISIFTSFPWYMLLRILFAICTSMVFPIVDGICLDFLKRYSNQEDYGKERLYGAIAWALTHLTIGPMLDKYQSFVGLYFLGIVAAIGMVLAVKLYTGHDSISLQNHLHIKRRTSDLVIDNGNTLYIDENSENIMALRTSNKSRNCVSFLMLFGSSCFSISFLIARVTLASGQAIVDKMVFLFFEFLGSSYTLMSLTVVLTVIFEIPIFQVARTILERFGSSGMLLLASFSYVTRVIGYTMIPSGKSSWVMIFEPLHGVTYACAQTAGVDFASKLIPEPGMEASSQGFLQFFVGGGSALGLLVGGMMQDAFGPYFMYRISAAVVFVGNGIFALSLIVSSRFNNKSTKNYSRERVQHHIIPQDDKGDGSVEMTVSPSVSISEE